MMAQRNYILILLLSNLSTFGQKNITESIIDFRMNCSEVVNSEDAIPEFTLLELSTNNEFTKLNFGILVNCAQKQMGKLLISKDTLIIQETDVTITSTTYNETDSVGNQLEVIEETQTAEYAFCDCLANFYYEFSIPVKNIRYLTFHERTFKINRTKDIF